MTRLLKWAWRFDLLWWLAQRYSYQYAYCFVFWRWWRYLPVDEPKLKPKPKLLVHYNPYAEDTYKRGWRRRAAADDSDMPADAWRDYGQPDSQTG